MKPNILVIDAAIGEPSAEAERLASQLAGDSYVYLVCQDCGFREDNDHGVRFVSHDPSSPPVLGELAAIVCYVDRSRVAAFADRYPGVPVIEARAGEEPPPAQAILRRARATRALPARAPGRRAALAA